MSVPFSGDVGPWKASSSVAPQLRVPFSDATWADDSVFPSIAPTCNKLAKQIQGMTASVLRQCQKHALVPNLKKGKTTLVLAMRGPGKQKVLRALFPGDSRSLAVDDGGVDKAFLHVQAQYTHLGGIVDREGSMRAEVRRRLAQASTAFQKNRALILQNTHVDIQTRGSLFRGLVTSTLYNLELWVPSLPSWPDLEAGYVKLLRRLLFPTGDPEATLRMSAEEVYYRTGQPPLSLLACVKRLGFLVGIAGMNCDIVWAVLQWEQDWAAQLRLDVQWLRKFVPDILEPSSQSWAKWQQLLTSRGQWFKQWCRKAMHQSFQCVLEQGGVAMFHRDLLRPIKGKLLLRHSKQGRSSWTCMPCAKTFVSKAALATHFFQKHGRKAAFRFYANGHVCRACGTDYHANYRLQTHLRDSKLCCDKLARLGERLQQVVPGFGSQQFRHDRAQNFVLCPPSEGSGSLPDGMAPERIWCDVPEMTRAFAVLCSNVLDIGEDGASDMALVAVAALRSFALFEHECQAVLARLIQEACELRDDNHVLPWGPHTDAAIRRLMWLRDNLSEILFAEEAYTVDGGLPDTRGWTAEQWRELLPDVITCDRVPLWVSDSGGQGTSTTSCVEDHCDFAMAVQLWNVDCWRNRKVFICLMENLEEVEYLRQRDCSPTSLTQCGAGRAWHVLRCLWLTALQGGEVRLLSGPEVRPSMILLPFTHITSRLCMSN